MRFSKGSVVYSLFVFTMIFNFSIGIVNASGLFVAFLDPDAYPGLDKELCENDLNNTPAGFNGTWKNVGGAGYKCYFRNTEQQMSREFQNDQMDLVLANKENPVGKSLVDSSQEASVFQYMQGLLGSFGNAIVVIPYLFELFSSSIVFPTQYLMTLFPCPDTNYYKEGVGIGRISLESEWGGDPVAFRHYNTEGLAIAAGGIITIKEAPCTTNTNVDGYELILGYIQNAMYLLYIIFLVQFIANRGFRGMT